MEIIKATKKDIDDLMTIRLEMLREVNGLSVLMTMMNLLSKIAVRTLLKEIRLIFFV